MLVCSSLKESRFIKGPSFNGLHFVCLFMQVALINRMEFSLDFYVPTFQCSQPPSIFFDHLISTGAYLSTFHLQLLSDKCYFHQYTCQLESLKRIRDSNGSSNVQFSHNQTAKITVDHPPWFTQRLSDEQVIRPTHFIDHLSEEVSEMKVICKDDSELSFHLADHGNGVFAIGQ